MITRAPAVPIKKINTEMEIDHLLCFVAEQLMTGNERERNGFLPGERQNRMFSTGLFQKFNLIFFNQSFSKFSL